MPGKTNEQKRQDKVRNTMRRVKEMPGGLSSEAFSRVLEKLGGALKSLKKKKKN